MSLGGRNDGALGVARECIAALDGPVYVACSGGFDSAALTALAAGARSDVRVLHVNHQLGEHAEALEDAARACAARHGLSFSCARVKVTPGSKGLEHAARIARYQAFAAQTPSDAIVLTGHTAEDAVETLLLRLGQGTGLRGLQGPRAEIVLYERRVVRPLLDVPRAALRCLVPEGAWHEDPMNDALRFRRVGIRRQVLPAWHGLADEIAAHLRSSCEQVREDSALLRQWTRAAFDACETEAPAGGFALSTLAPPSSAEAWRALIHLGMEGCSIRPSRDLIARIASLADARPGTSVLGHGCRAERWLHRVVICPGVAREALPRFGAEPTPLDAAWRAVGEWELSRGAESERRAAPRGSHRERFAQRAIQGALLAELAPHDAPFRAFGADASRPVGAWLQSDGWNAFERERAIWIRDDVGPLWIVGGRRSARAPLTDPGSNSERCVALSAQPRGRHGAARVGAHGGRGEAEFP